MFDSKFKKDVGFIKNNSSKKNLHSNQQHRNDSSDSFSSFQYHPKIAQQQFSPYRHPIDMVVNKKSISQPKFQPQKNVQKKQEYSHPSFSNLILRNNFTQDPKLAKTRKADIERDLEKVNKKIRQVKAKFENQEEEDSSEEEGNETPKLPEEIKVEDYGEEELSLSNINRFQNEHQSLVSQGITPQAQPKYPKTLVQYRKYLEQSSQEQHQNLKNKQTFKNSPQKIAAKRHQEQLITEWDKRQFKDKRIKTAILQHNNGRSAKTTHQNGLVESKGGVSFDVDTRQFKGVPTRKQFFPQKKNRIDVNSRQQIMMRRQAAKRYDREARIKTFGYA